MRLLCCSLWKTVILNLFAEWSKSRLTNWLEGHTKEILTQVNWHILLYSRTKSVTQNIRGSIERLLRAAQKLREPHVTLKTLNSG